MKTYTYKKLEQNGRLGNQLWQIAWQVGQARQGSKVSVKANWEYRDYFSLPEDWYNPPEGKIIDGGDQWYQELDYWDHCEAVVWDAFQPSRWAAQELEVQYPDFFFDPKIHKTAVHFRRGDYLKYPNKFPVLPASYYDNAMKLAQEANPETLFVMFSDDFEFLKRYEGDQFYIVEGVPRSVSPSLRKGQPEDQWDLFLMTKCQEHIIANSTFSWWGAYLSKEGSAYYPSMWFGSEPSVASIPWRKAIPIDWKEVNVS